MAITSGTHTIGSGGDYATLNAFTADIGTQTGNLIGRAISDYTISANTFFQHDMAGFNLTLDSDTDHLGSATSAHAVTVAHNNNGINPTSLLSNEGDFTVTGFRMNRSVAGSNATKSLIAAFNFTGELYIHHMFVDGGGVNGNGIGVNYSSTTDIFVYTNVIWDCAFIGIFLEDFGASSAEVNTLENNSIRNCGEGIGDVRFATLATNNVSFTSTTDFTITSTTDTGNNNASTDATADDWNTEANNLINLTEVDEVVSTDDTSSDFMVPKSTSNIKDSGKAPTIAANTTDMTGTLYSGTNPIGAYLEPVTPATGFGALLAGQRNQLVF